MCCTFGHKSFSCPNDQTPAGHEVSTDQSSEQNIKHKNVFVNNKSLLALINTGSDATIFLKSAQNKISCPILTCINWIIFFFCNLSVSNKILIAFDNLQVKPIGYFSIPTIIDNEEFFPFAFVLDNFKIPVDLIFGTNIFSHTDIHINKDGIFNSWIM